jgi:hypothetical protein
MTTESAFVGASHAMIDCSVEITRAFPVLMESEPGSSLLFRRIFFTRTDTHFARKCSRSKSGVRFDRKDHEAREVIVDD